MNFYKNCMLVITLFVAGATSACAENYVLNYAISSLVCGLGVGGAASYVLQAGAINNLLQDSLKHDGAYCGTSGALNGFLCSVINAGHVMAMKRSNPLFTSMVCLGGFLGALSGFRKFTQENAQDNEYKSPYLVRAGLFLGMGVAAYFGGRKLIISSMSEQKALLKFVD